MNFLCFLDGQNEVGKNFEKMLSNFQIVNYLII